MKNSFFKSSKKVLLILVLSYDKFYDLKKISLKN